MASLFPALQKFSVKAGIAPAFLAAGIKANANEGAVVGTRHLTDPTRCLKYNP